jgi:hypothetical protein
MFSAFFGKKEDFRGVKDLPERSKLLQKDFPDSMHPVEQHYIDLLKLTDAQMKEAITTGQLSSSILETHYVSQVKPQLIGFAKKNGIGDASTTSYIHSLKQLVKNRIRTQESMLMAGVKAAPQPPMTLKRGGRKTRRHRTQKRKYTRKHSRKHTSK